MSRAWSKGALWLAHGAAAPETVLRTWADDLLAAIPTGSAWVAVEAPLRPSMDAMERLGRVGKLGPVLAYPEAERAWWLTYPHAGEHLEDLALLTVHPQGWPLRCPSPDRVSNGRGWLEKPDGLGTLTDPAALGAAFGRGGRLPAEVLG